MKEEEKRRKRRTRGRAFLISLWPGWWWLVVVQGPFGACLTIRVKSFYLLNNASPFSSSPSIVVCILCLALHNTIQIEWQIDTISATTAALQVDTRDTGHSRPKVGVGGWCMESEKHENPCFDANDRRRDGMGRDDDYVR